MMGIFDWGHGRDSLYFECRQCGSSVEQPDARCDVCGATEIAVYEL
jgi:rubrerythrin